MTRAAVFAQELLRTPFIPVLLIALPVLFVAASADVLSEFARALGGDLAADAAAALGAGWAAAFVSGVLGLFQAASARGADRRLALAGAGPARVAASRIGASVLLAVLAVAASLATLLVTTGVAHPAHAAAALAGFALTYLAVGVLIGCLVHGPLEGSLLVALVFILDVFSGSGMSEDPALYSISRPAADILIRAGLGRGSPAGDWAALVIVAALTLAACLAAFTWTARSRV